ncbi:MAG: flagellar biosynthesis protein FlgN [Microbacteriaceae bacterium]|jgi:aryl carrier-like protein|nr:flagellar biosynthesis protein FlgN [Microbacteriaceae bacterium]
MGAHELSAALWRERELLELLVFKLTEEQLLLTSGKARWLQYATQEVEQVMQRLRSAGLARSVEVTTLAEEWGAAAEVTLRELTAHATDDTWRDILASHLAAMADLTKEIQELRDLNVQYLRAAIRSTQESLAGDGATSGTYDAKGVGHSSTAARIFDLSL